MLPQVVLMFVCTCICLPCVLQRVEIWTELPVLPAHCGHSRLSKPHAGEAWMQRDLWGPVPQLHTRASARLLPSADLRSRVGEIQRGKDVWNSLPPPTHTHVCPQLFSLFLSPPCALFCFISDISTPIVQIFTYQTHHPSHLSWAETSRDHALGLLISDANLHLFSQRSKWSHLQPPLGDTPSCTATWWREDSFCPPLILSLEHSQAAWLRLL